MTARYDDFADWYVEETASWEPGLLSPLPSKLVGCRVLELACGHGRGTRFLARAGAVVTGVDLSARLIAYARAAEAKEPVGATFLHGDATSLDWWDGCSFDGVVCDMALMDIDDLDGAVKTAAAVLSPGGWFAFSLVHPCHPGGPGTVSGLPSWPPDRGYAEEGWWTTGEAVGIRGRVGANHRMLSTYLNAMLAAGFGFEAFVEPPFVVPRFFGARCRLRS